MLKSRTVAVSVEKPYDGGVAKTATPTRLFCLVAVLTSKLHVTNSPQSDKTPSIFNDTS